MKKSIIYVFVTVFILISAAIPTCALNHTNIGTTFTQQQEAELEASAESIKQKFGIDVFLLQENSNASAKELADNFLAENSVTDSYFLYSITSDYYYCAWSEDFDLCFSEGDADYILEKIVGYEEDLYSFFSEYYSVMSNLLDNRLSVPYKYVRDQAGVLTDDKEKSLNEKLTALREKYKFDIVVVTANGVHSEDRMPYADDYYDYNGYGYGKNKDGVLLLVNINPDGSYSTNNSWVSTCGSGLDYIDDEDIEDIGKELTPLLLNGDYGTATDKFADIVASNIRSYRFKNVLIVLAITFVIAAIVAFIYLAKLKKNLISVAAAVNANDYIVKNSLKIKRSYELFLYADVSRTARESSRSGGSSSHTSSSGTSHGGGGF